MPLQENTPVGLKPYLAHGVDLNWGSTNGEALGDCPYCGKHKFYVSCETGQYDCKVCGQQGNALSFVRSLWEQADQIHPQLAVLATERGLLSAATLGAWGVRLLENEVVVPGWTTETGQVGQLWRYTRPHKSAKRLLMATAGLGMHLHAPLVQVKHLRTWEQYLQSVKTLYIAEGCWDGMVLGELISQVKVSKGGLVSAGDPMLSLAATCAVVAVPGANAFTEKWAKLLSAPGRTLVFLYDNDHPKKVCSKCRKGWSIVHTNCQECGGELTGPLRPPAGLTGTRRAAQLVMGSETPPAALKYLYWGDGGKYKNEYSGFDPQRPDGYDLRDWLTQGQARSLPNRIHHMAAVLSNLRQVPAEWFTAVAKKDNTAPSVLEPTPCESWARVVNEWRKAMKWIPGLEKGLSVILASAVSTRCVGDQLWILLMSPASSGKTTLCEALGVARRYVKCKDTLTGLISGYQTDREGTENMSLIQQLKDMTLIVKDGDTLLSEPNLPRILAQFRAAYDRALRSSYGNKMSTDHDNINMTVVVAGTSSLYRLDSAELGTRWLCCSIMDEIDDELEDEIMRRKARQARAGLLQESNGVAESQLSPEMASAYKSTAGYLCYLRENAQTLLAQVVMSEEAEQQCINLAKFVSYMRARPSKQQTEMAERELASRLVSQFVRLACCLAVVTGKCEVDASVLVCCKGVAMDTARGRTLKLCQLLSSKLTSTWPLTILPPGQNVGMTTQTLALHTGQSEVEERGMLVFMRKIGMVTLFHHFHAHGAAPQKRWHLTEKLAKLYMEVTRE